MKLRAPPLLLAISWFAVVSVRAEMVPRLVSPTRQQFSDEFQRDEKPASLIAGYGPDNSTSNVQELAKKKIKKPKKKKKKAVAKAS